MTTLTLPGSQTKSSRPAKPTSLGLAEAAEAFLAAMASLSDRDRHRISVDLNMRHDILLVDLERHHKGLIDVCRRAARE